MIGADLQMLCRPKRGIPLANTHWINVVVSGFWNFVILIMFAFLSNHDRYSFVVKTTSKGASGTVEIEDLRCPAQP